MIADGTGKAYEQVLFIDGRVSDLQQLVDAVRPGELIHVLDSNADGLQQIVDFLQGNDLSGLSAVSIVGHGREGEIALGSSVLDDAALAADAGALGAIGAALAPGGDLLLYGCDVAQGADGLNFIQDLGKLTAADVAAATHSIGGDDSASWTLDARTDAVEASTPFDPVALAGYADTLDLVPSHFIVRYNNNPADSTSPAAYRHKDTTKPPDPGTWTRLPDGSWRYEYQTPLKGEGVPAGIVNHTQTYPNNNSDTHPAFDGNRPFTDVTMAVPSAAHGAQFAGHSEQAITTADATDHVAFEAHYTNGTITPNAEDAALAPQAGLDPFVQLYNYFSSLFDGDADITADSSGNTEIEVGSGGTATISGGDKDDNVYVWHQKNVAFDGGAGTDTLVFDSYLGGPPVPTTGATVNLKTGTGTNPFGGTLTLTNLENVSGTSKDDDITGNDSDNRLGAVFLNGAPEGTGGNDSIHGEGGNDTLGFFPLAGEHVVLADGGSGTDTLIVDLNFQTANSHHILDLNNPANNTGVFKGAVISNLEVYSVGDLDSRPGAQASFEFHGTDANETVQGGWGDDTLIGGDGDDRLIGNDGIDTLLGGPGNDTLDSSFATMNLFKPNPGADHLDGGPGTDHALIQRQFSTLTFTLDLHNPGVLQTLADGTTLVNVEQVDFFAGPGNDTLIGGAFADSLFGGPGNDTLQGGPGADHLEGDAGDDTFVFQPGDGQDIITDFTAGAGTPDKIDLQSFSNMHTLGDVLALATQGPAGTVIDFGNGDTLTLNNVTKANLSVDDFVGLAPFTEGADTVTLTVAGQTSHALGGDDVVTGTSGDDTIFGDAGKDTLNGGDGNDTLVGNANPFASEADTLNGGNGNDTLYVENSDTFSGGPGQDFLYVVNSNPIHIDMGATSIEWIQSDFGNDVIDASTQTVGVEIYSDGGDDTITGSPFNDIIWSGSGNDTVNAGDGDDVVVSDVGTDTVSGGNGNDSLYVGPGDTFDGGAGFDAGYVTDGTGLTVDLAATHMEWFADFVGGNDNFNGSGLTVRMECYAGAGDDTVTGGSGNDFLWGEAGNDTVSGGAGNDTLVGGTGADTLTGGPGTDALYGNSGNGGDGAVDTFVFTDSWGTDFVFDFEHGIDKLDVSAVTGLNSFSDFTVTDTPDGHCYLSFNGNLIAVANHTSAQVTASDFIF